MEHTTSHTIAVQFPSSNQQYILIGRQWYQLPEFIPPISNPCQSQVRISFREIVLVILILIFLPKSAHLCRAIQAPL